MQASSPRSAATSSASPTRTCRKRVCSTTSAGARAARGICKRELGRLDEAEDDLRFAIRIAEELGDRQLPGWTWRALARVSELRGDQAEAEERHRRSREAIIRGPR